jgi:hypothetical protein
MYRNPQCFNEYEVVSHSLGKSLAWRRIVYNIPGVEDAVGGFWTLRGAVAFVGQGLPYDSLNTVVHFRVAQLQGRVGRSRKVPGNASASFGHRRNGAFVLAPALRVNPVSSMLYCRFKSSGKISWVVLKWHSSFCGATQHNDIQHNDTQHKGLVVTLSMNDVKNKWHTA